MVSFDVILRSGYAFSEELPVKRAIGLPTHVFTKSKIYGVLLTIFLQILPALLVDGILKLLGKKPM